MPNEPEPNTRAGEALKLCSNCGFSLADDGGCYYPYCCEPQKPNTRPLPGPSELVDDDARLILRLAGVVNRLTPGAIERADLDGMAFTVREAEDRIAELSAQIAKLQADGDKLAGAATALEQAEADYRFKHDHLGASNIETGRAWDAMRRAGCDLRQALTEWKDRS